MIVTMPDGGGGFAVEGRSVTAGPAVQLLDSFFSLTFDPPSAQAMTR